MPGFAWPMIVPDSALRTSMKKVEIYKKELAGTLGFCETNSKLEYS